MRGAAIDFGPSIQAHAKARNRVLSQEEVDHLGATLNSLATLEGSALTFALSGDQRGDLHQALDIYGEGFGKPAGAEISQTTIPSPDTMNATQRAMAKVQAERSRRSGDAAAVAAAGNPWAAGSTFNRTAQAIITLRDPALAARLRNEANSQ